MSRKRRKRGSTGERFVALPHYMLNCLAWAALSPNGKAVLMQVWQRHDGSNNGAIVYAVREGEKIGLSRSATARALKELVDLGFLSITLASGFTVKTKEARHWAITAERINGNKATSDFMRWSPEKNKTQSRQRDRQSLQRDCGDENATILPISVPLAGPLTAELAAPQSRQRDTYISTIRRVRFGDAAKAQRTVRQYAPAEGRGGLTANESEAAAPAERRIDDNFEEDGGRGLTRLGDVLGNVLAAAAARR